MLRYCSVKCSWALWGPQCRFSVSTACVWQARSFSAAAKKLYISQPALSNSIKRVEEKVGTPIFDRSTSPIQLTEVGREYIHAVEQIHSIQENFSRYLADTQELRTGNIAVGSGAMMTAYLLPGIIASYKEKYPYVEVKVTEGSCAICWPRAHWMWCWKTRRCPQRCWKASPTGGIIWCWPCRAAGPSTPSCAHGS
ncbi:MAG: LysR family transcriptional regulator [Oscillospiraceae bacterium]|nr:LysR family transcriptional regulator [Oscillospiraceae bacterium]